MANNIKQKNAEAPQNQIKEEAQDTTETAGTVKANLFLELPKNIMTETYWISWQGGQDMGRVPFNVAF